ncbi:MAG: GNAT family N-acetyltransferase [Candidatus Parabeggiatoa sp. nov. 1]|nr:MAG: GNAT family N-acetyltransferase [Gammaproteobacteria bacterium]
MISVAPLGLQTLQGRRVILERSAPEHAPFLLQCYQDNEFMDLYRLAQKRSQTEEQLREQLAKEQTLLPQQLKRIEWIIHRVNDNGEKQPIGLAAIADYKPAHRRAEFLMGILFPSYRGTRFSVEASLLIMDFAFNQIQLRKLIAYTYGYNAFAQRNLVSFGFIQEGLLRQHIYSQNGFLDLYLNGLLESDFRANQRLSRFSQRILGRDVTSKPTPPEVLSEEQIAQAKETVFKALRS